MQLTRQAVTPEEELIEFVVATCDGRRIGLYFKPDGVQSIQDVLLFLCGRSNHAPAFYSL